MRRRRVKRIATTEPPPILRGGFGFGDPVARQAELVDMMMRPGMRRATTLRSRFPNETVMAKAEPVALTAGDGTQMFMLGDPFTGRTLA